MKWPERIKAKSIIDHPTSLMDFLPTINELIDNEVNSPKQIDGRSYLGQLITKNHDK